MLPPMKPITHTLLEHDSLRHGFFTREGGMSSGLYGSLNVGIGSGDDPKKVQQNREIVAEHFGTDTDHLMTCFQVHSREVVTVDTPGAPRAEADGMVTNTPGLVLGILTADCAPVLFADTEAGVIGAAHAGWKGALRGVLDNTIDAMEKLGAVRTRIHAVVGPCIGPESYEVGQDFIEEFIRQDSSHIRFCHEHKDGGVAFDLPGFVLARLALINVDAVWTGDDTLTDEQRFFSYRRKTLRGEADYGRQISAIMLT